MSSIGQGSLNREQTLTLDFLPIKDGTPQNHPIIKQRIIITRAIEDREAIRENFDNDALFDPVF